MLKAKFIDPKQNGYNYGHDKEMVDALSAIAKGPDGKLKEFVVVRCYMGRSSRASTVYASLWVHGDGVYAAGTGSAGGYGYCKRSAAVASAISSAGIELYGSLYTEKYNYAEERPYTPAENRAAERKAQKTRVHIGGVGMDAVRDAVEAIARAAGARGQILIVTH